MLKNKYILMNRLKSFNEKRYQYLIESVNTIDINNFEKVLENFNYSKYQRIANKIQKDLNIELFYVKNFNLTISSLYPVVKKVIEIGEFNIPLTEKNTVLVTICAINALVRENKEIVEKLFSYAKKNNIPQEELKKVINIIENIYFLFKEISNNFSKSIIRFSDMISYTPLLVPFNTVLMSLMNQGKLTIGMLNELPNMTDNLNYKMLINRIMHKLEIIVSSTDKFQNTDNIKPLLVNWDLKSPELRPDKVKID